MTTPTETTCARHPGTETRLRCSQCDTPICPRCSVTTPVGQKCPDCARQPRTARALGKPRQFAKAAAAGVGAALVAALVLPYVFRFGWFSWILSGVAGYLVARAVQWGAEGNRAPAFRWGAVVLAVAAIGGAWLQFGRLIPGALGAVTYLAAAYGAWLRFER